MFASALVEHFGAGRVTHGARYEEFLQQGPSRRLCFAQQAVRARFRERLPLEATFSLRWLPPAEVRYVVPGWQQSLRTALASRTGGSVGGWSSVGSQDVNDNSEARRSGTPLRPQRQILPNYGADDALGFGDQSTISIEVPSTRVPTSSPSVPWELAVFGSVVAASALRDRKYQPLRGSLVKEEQISVARVHIALRDDVKDFVRRALRELAASVDTTQPQELLRLLRTSSLIMERACEVGEGWYATAYDVLAFDASNTAEAERSFRQMSLQIKGNWQEDTFLNLDGIRRVHSYEHERSKDPPLQAATQSNLMVVTFVVAVQGLQGPVSSARDALRSLHTVAEGKLLAVEILWTPDREDDTLSEEEMITQFPELVRTTISSSI
ncbi:hypothetical protein CCYA_CCYA08G2452 [Cyanidiococcus yangmingshanensis]|nr:hypothetical protein CCYA_CCYA08G2452 [Cyanidiococcus yangmingshanensis]